MKLPKTPTPGLILMMTLIALAHPVLAQTASTGALAGAITDPNRAMVANVKVTVTNEATGESRTVVTGPDGQYRAPLLPPGAYRLEAGRDGFKTATRSGVSVVVTETVTLNLQLEVGATTDSVTVQSTEELAQTESSALGRVTNERVVKELPLVTRNYTQILGLSPGIITNVNNANELGRGSSGLSGGAGDVHVHGGGGAETYFTLDGGEINAMAGGGRA